MIRGRAAPWVMTCAAVACLPGPIGSAAGAPAYPHTAPPAQQCGDLLGAIGRRPPALRFIGCTYLPARQGRPLEATYRVEGRSAVHVEAYLRRSIGLPRLRRSCCQWDHPPRFFKDRQGRVYELTMTSTETFVRDRANWADIAFFEIVVSRFTEEI